MSLIVFSAIGIAIWHFTVFLPDRFWGGIVGAFLGAWLGAVASGVIFQLIAGRTIGETDVLTVAAAIPGTVIGMAVIWRIGVKAEERAAMELEAEEAG